MTDSRKKLKKKIESPKMPANEGSQLEDNISSIDNQRVIKMKSGRLAVIEDLNIVVKGQIKLF